MSKLSELKTHSQKLYEEFMGEVLKQDDEEFVTHCIERDTSMLSAAVFKRTAQGVDYWWDIMDKIEANEEQVK